MKILVVGGGGREHAIIKKIKLNPAVTQIFALPGNGGMAQDATLVNIGAKDISAIVQFAKDNKIDHRTRPVHRGVQRQREQGHAHLRQSPRNGRAWPQ